MPHDTLFADLTREYERPFAGWDFSALAGRRVEDAPPWSFADLSRTMMRDATALLDLGTGGGERLSALHDAFPPSVVATEGYPPNLALARERLAPLGVEVYDSAGSLSERLPFASGAFDLVISRNTGFNAAEVARVLRDGGAFLTQQVDGRPQDLQTVFGAPALWPYFTLDFMRTQITGAGLTIERAAEWTGAITYTDLGALVYFLKAVPWVVPDFSVARSLPHLQQLQRQLERDGTLVFHQTLMLAVVRKGVGPVSRIS